MSINGGYYSPGTYALVPDECSRCPRCHPGKQFGGDEACRSRYCGCHRRTE